MTHWHAVLLSLILGMGCSLAEENRVPKGGDPDFPEPRGHVQRHDEKVAAAQSDEEFDLLLIGDSITHALDNPAFSEVWERHFAPRRALNLGVSGNRTENVLWRLQNGELPDRAPKAMTLLIGTNNMDDANYPIVHSPEQVVVGTRAILDLLGERYPGVPVLLIRTLPRTNTYQHKDGSERGSAEARLADCLRAGELQAALADDERVFFLDINGIFTREDGSLDPKLMPDLLHPSPEGAALWAEAMEPFLSEHLGAPEPLEQENGE